MKRVLSYLVAFLACAAELLLYGFICAMMGWKKGGGYFLMIIVFSIMSVTWTSIVAAFKKKNRASLEERQDCSNKEINSRPQFSSASESSPNCVKTSDLCNYENGSQNIDTKVSVSTVESDNHCNRTKDTNKNVKDYHSLLKGLLIIMMVYSTINLFSQLLRNLMLDNLAVGACQFIGGLINLFAFVLIYKKNIWGIIIFAFMMFFQIPLNIFFGSEDLQPIILSGVIRFCLLSIFLLIRKDGISGWSLLIQNSDFSSFKKLFNRVSKVSVTDESVAKAKQTFASSSYAPKSAEQIIEDKNKTDESNKTLVYELKSNDNNKKIALGKFLKFENIGQFFQFRKRNPSTEKNSNRNRYFILVAVMVVLAGAIGSVINVLVHDYPDCAETFAEKACLCYGLNNDELCEKLIHKGEKASSQDLNELAKQYLRDAAKLNTKNEKLLLSITKNLYVLEDFSTVKELCDRGNKLFPNQSEFYAIGARTRYDLHDFSEVAILLAEKALEIDPQSENAFIALMLHNYSHSKYEEAIKWAKKQRSYRPEDARVYYFLTYCLIKTNKYDEAKQNYHLGVKLNPTHSGRSNIDEEYGSDYFNDN